MNVDIRLQVVTMLPRLRRFALSLTGSRDRADDIVQATCERALRAAASWEPGTRLDSWLYRIMQNLWIDEIRKARPRGTEVPVEEVDELSGEDGERTALARLSMQQVLRALEQLPAEQRSVVSLVCIEDISYREVADILAIPVGTVMSRLSRARAALGALLQPEGSAPEARSGG